MRVLVSLTLAHIKVARIHKMLKAALKSLNKPSFEQWRIKKMDAVAANRIRTLP